MKILFIGPPASGKGTIGKMLSEKLKIPLVGSGALLREVPETHPRYQEINDLMLKGSLVPQEFVASLLKDRLQQEDCGDGYIVEGWGRKMLDLEIFEPDLDYVVAFDLSRNSALKRITGRRMCDSDGKIYNIYTLPEKELKKCKGNLIQRDDDKEEVVNHRIDLYEKETLPVIEYLKKKYATVEIDAEPLPDEIFSNLCEMLEIDD